MSDVASLGRRVFIPVTAALFTALSAAAPAHAAEVPPAPTEFVTDHADVLPEGTIVELNRTLSDFEQQTSNQIVVYIDERIPEDTDLEEFAVDAFEAWQIGQKDRDNGVLFVVFTEERAARIEVGYGLEGAIPDALAARILREQAIPSFERGEWATGVQAGVRGITSASQGEYEGTGEGNGAGGEPGGSFPIAGLAFLFFFILPLIRGLGRSRRYGKGRTYASHGWWIWPLLWSLGGGHRGSSRGSSWGGFPRGGGGFSGGGGLSGGGGASGRW